MARDGVCPRCHRTSELSRNRLDRGLEIEGAAEENRDVPLFAVVATQLATTAVQSILTGSIPDNKQWGDAVSPVLAALLAEQDTTNETLVRLESKIDRLDTARFAQPLAAGMRFVQEAQPPWRDRPEREHLRRQARTRFIDAVAGAQTPVQEAIAEFHLALVWLLIGSPGDCLAALERARWLSFRALSDTRTAWLYPPRDELRDEVREPLSSRFKRMSGYTYKAMKPGGVYIPSRESVALSQVRERTRPMINFVLDVAQGVQVARAALGLPRASCAPPRLAISPKSDMWRLEPPNVNAEVMVDLQGGHNDILGFGIEVHDAKITRREVRESLLGERVASRWLVDAKISLFVPASPAVPQVRVLAEGGAVDGVTNAGHWQRMLDLDTVNRSDNDLPPYPTPHLIVKSPYSYDGTVVLEPERKAHGWIRLQSGDEPKQLTCRLWPFPHQVHAQEDPGLLATWSLPIG